MEKRKQKNLTPEEKQRKLIEMARKVEPEEDQMVEYMKQRKLKMA